MAKGTKTGGRKKGTPNKVSGDLRALVLKALDTAGGEAYLVRQAEESPASFIALIGKCLPRELTGANGDPLIPVSPTLNLTLTNG